MDMQKLVDAAFAQANAMVDEMCDKAGQISLGELRVHLLGAKQNAVVKFSDGTYPGDFDSYRGFYRFIAIDRGEKCNVATLLTRVESAIGQTFTGYKGGEFLMTRRTPVWVSEYGKADNIGVVGVAEINGDIILQLGKIDNDEQ